MVKKQKTGTKRIGLVASWGIRLKPVWNSCKARHRRSPWFLNDEN
jgi:hypothetical protein